MKVYILYYEYTTCDDEEQEFEILNVAYSRETLVKKVLDLIAQNKEEDFNISQGTNLDSFCLGKTNRLTMFYGDDENYSDINIYYRIKEIEIEI